MQPEARDAYSRLLHEGWIDATRKVHAGQRMYTYWTTEAAFRQEAWAAVVLVPAGLWLGHSAVERVMLVGSVLLLMIIELVNTAIEVVVDRIGVERHHLSGFAKDLGSSAVLLALVLVGATWLLILWDRINPW